MQIKLLGITNVEFDVIGQWLTTSSISIRNWGKGRSITAQHISCLQISRKPTIQLGGTNLRTLANEDNITAEWEGGRWCSMYIWHILVTVFCECSNTGLISE
jgi:hypothetical protein